MPLTLKVEGLEDAIAALRAVQGALGDEHVERMLLAEAAIPLRDQVAWNAPRGQTGELKRSLVAKAGRRKPNAPSAIVAVDFKQISKKDKAGEPVRYPYMVEYGVKPTILRPKHGKWMYAWGKFRVREIHYGGFEGRRFFRRAISTMRAAIMARVETRLRKMIEAATALQKFRGSATPFQWK